MNVQCAFAFFVDPDRYTHAYELTGIPGEAVIRGFGILFLMWNIPYVVAVIHPLKHWTSLWESITMQTIGLVGESLIFKNIPPEHAVLSQSIQRFIIFDGVGLAILLMAAWFTHTQKTKSGEFPDTGLP